MPLMVSEVESLEQRQDYAKRRGTISRLLKNFSESFVIPRLFSATCWNPVTFVKGISDGF
jgi:hypothetical protein